MREKLKIEIGKTYNRLTVVKQLESDGGSAKFECKCLCGNVCQANASQLFHSKKKSCGCQKIDSAKILCVERNTTHGLSHTKKYAKTYQDRTREKHKKRIKDRKRKYQKDLKLKVFKAYSKDGIIKCCRCGENDDRVLNIDHINGGGRIHQRKVSNIYQDLLNRNFPEGFQVLCQNCNIIKMHENNEMHRVESINSNLHKNCKQKLRRQLIYHYSNGANSCKKCGNDNFYVLCLDHIEGGGCKDFRKNGNLWYYLKRNNFPIGMQVLCQNCNRRKMYENNEYSKR